jgi:putative hydrolase of the HAD superfamily
MHRIRAVFFDFYNTIARFDPPREETQAQASARFGIQVDSTAVSRSYQIADEFLSRENEAQALAQRSRDEVGIFWSRYEQLLLSGAGVEVDLETAGKIFAAVREVGEGFVLFADADPTLRALREMGYRVGLISNMNDDLWALSKNLGIAEHLQCAVTSGDVGAAKPNPPIFLEALKLTGTAADETVHIGDQYLGDIAGARGVGIQPILIDRDGSQAKDVDCPVIQTLEEVPDLLEVFKATGRPG